MDVDNEDTVTKGGEFRDEDIERALKLSLDPQEQTSKDLQGYVLACKESLRDAKPVVSSNRDKKLSKNTMSLIDDEIINNSMASNSNVNINDGSEYKNKCNEEYDDIIKSDKKLHTDEQSAESISDIKCIKTKDSDILVKISNSNESNNGANILKSKITDSKEQIGLGLINASTKALKSSPTKDQNKKKRKPGSSDTSVKHGMGHKPMPLAQAAAVVKEPSVCKCIFYHHIQFIKVKLKIRWLGLHTTIDNY